MAKKKTNNNEVIVKIDGDAWIKALDKAFKKKVKEVTIPGFRKGKAPRDVYEKKYGKESLYLEASDLVITDAYKKALEDSKLIPVVQPVVDITNVDENGVEFKFIIITKPEVNIKKYKGLNVKAEKVEVTQEEIDHEIHHILERYTELKVKEDGKVENGNIAVIDFEGFKDGVAFEGGKGENYELEIGSNTFIPGFEEQLVGMKTNEEKDINVTFPEDYPKEDLQGAPVVFKVKVNEIKEKVERDFDEELFEDLGMEGVDTKDKLEAQIKENIMAQKEVDAENKHVDMLLEEIAKHTEVDIPEEMVEEEVGRLLGRFEEQLKMQGISLDIYYQFTRSSEKDLRAQLEKEAYSHVLYRLMLEEIAKLEKVEISKEEVEKEADKLAEKYQIKKDEFLKMFGGLDMIEYDMQMRRVIDMLKEANK